MKKFIPLLILSLGLLSFQSCRNLDGFEMDVSPPLNKPTSIARQVHYDKSTDTHYGKSTDARYDRQEVQYNRQNVNLIDLNGYPAKDNDPDPPVKDGQDWRGASTSLSNHASTLYLDSSW